MAPSKAYTRSDLQAFLSSSLGVAKAREVVDETLRELGIHTEVIDTASARRVLERVAGAEGLVGVIGRVALTRFEAARSDSAVTKRVRRPLEVVAGLLAPTLGKERAESLVREHARTLGLPNELDLDQALLLLEHIAKIPGVTGIAARFAKTRINLTW